MVTTVLEENTTDYLGGFQYENTVLQFFPHAEGYVKHTPDKYGNPTFDYVYNYTDHLGNIRLSYTLDPLTHVLKILEENHYYPFGLKHTNYNSDRRNFTKETETDPKKVIPVLDMAYKYKYNGKEWQDELGLNMYDMDMRQYDPAIARWVVQDPVIHHNFSPYSAFDNNPTVYADPSGADAWEDKDGYHFNGDDAKNALAALQTSSNSSSEEENSNEEPPINLFAPFQDYKGSDKKLASEDKRNKTFNGVVDSRDFVQGDGIFSLYAHAALENGEYFIYDQRDGYNNKKIIRSVHELNKILMESSPEWKNAMENNKKVTLYLFSCGSATGGKNSMAGRFSHAFPNVTTVGGLGNFQYQLTPGGYAVVGLTAGLMITFQNGVRNYSKDQRIEDYLKEKNLNTKPTKM